VLFGGDPVDASAAALDTIAGEVPTSRVVPDDLRDVIDLLAGTGLATSRSDARRLVQQGSVRANDQVVTADWRGDEVELLHGRYLLLRKGKRTFHLVEVLKAAG
jgi:tyrosyl-tRNA synthetase